MRLRLLLPLLLVAAPSRAEEPADRLTALVEAYLEAGDAAGRREPLAEIEAAPLAEVETAISRARFSRAKLAGRTTVRIPLPGGAEPASYELVVPPGYDPSSRYPLLVAIPGAGATGGMEVDLWRSRTDARGWILACPTERPERSDPGWGSTDPERELIRAVVADARRRASVDPDRVVLTGESRGGHASWEMGIVAPDLWAGIAPRAGGPRMLLRPALGNLVPVPVHDIQGGGDQPSLVGAVREACEALRKMGGDVTYVEIPERGHTGAPEDLDRVLAWAEGRVRNLYRKQAALTLGPGTWTSAAWLRVDGLARGVPDPRTVRPAVRARPGASSAELRRAFVADLERRLSQAEASIEPGNRIVVRTRNVTRVTLFLCDRLVDLDRPVTVVWNGRPERHEAHRSIGFLLDHVRETGDTGRRFTASLTVP